jgi:thiamine biosynthesis lipoprotein
MAAANSESNRRVFAARELAGMLLGGGTFRAGARTVKQVLVARRAMACEFSLLFPAECRTAVDAGCAALDEVERLEARLSVYLDDSELSYVNRAAVDATVKVDHEIITLLRAAASLSQATGGAFDVAAGALVKAWGFYRGPRRVPAEPRLQAALASTGMRHVELDPEAGTVRFRRPVEINLGSLGKGYAIDRAMARIRREFGIHCALMQGGQSSFRAAGEPMGEPRGWKIAIGDPDRRGRTAATIHLRNRALGTSGGAHQFFIEGGRRYAHVLDPRTGRPADQVSSATAVAPTAAEADALSTAFFVLGVEATRAYCRKHAGIGAVLVAKAGHVPRVIVTGEIDAEVNS